MEGEGRSRSYRAKSVIACMLSFVLIMRSFTRSFMLIISLFMLNYKVNGVLILGGEGVRHVTQVLMTHITLTEDTKKVKLSEQ